MWMTMGLLVVVALGAAWKRGGLDAIRELRGRVAQAETRDAEVVQQGRARDTDVRSITLSVTSVPRATVFIDGARVGETPVAGRTLIVGRTYRIRVEKKGYRTRTETITATGARPVHRGYVLERVSRR